MEIIKEDDMPKVGKKSFSYTAKGKAEAKKYAQKLKKSKSKRLCICVKESPIHGKGLFATKNIKANTILGSVKGRLNDNRERYAESIYRLWLEDDKSIIVTNDLKYINHSKDANVSYYGNFKVGTIKNISKGEEITHNYGDDWE